MIGTCDCCGAQDVELVRSELAGLETWSCWEECPKPRDRTASLLMEGVAVTLLFACIFVWTAIYHTGGLQ